MRSRSSVGSIAATAVLLFASACGSGMLNVGYPTGVTGGGGGTSVGSPATYVGAIGDSLKRGTT